MMGTPRLRVPAPIGNAPSLMIPALMRALATSIAYVNGNAHIWQDENHPADGHIIGPGRMQGLRPVDPA